MKHILLGIISIFIFPIQLSAELSVGDPVYALYNDGFYKATVVKISGKKVDVKWLDGGVTETKTLDQVKPRFGHDIPKEKIQDWDQSDETGLVPIDDSKPIVLWDRLPLSTRPKGKKVYAMYSNGMYYTAFELEKKGADTLVRWADNTGEMWVNSVKPLQGHGIKPDLMGERQLTAAEIKAERNRKENYAVESQIACSKLKTSLDCLRTFDPCVWNQNKGCVYNGN